jgi:hypothetical protein
MLNRLCLAAALMGLGCGGADGTPEFDAGAEAGSAGSVAQAGSASGASAQGGSNATAGAAQAGAGGLAASAGQGGTASNGGQPEPQGGMPSAGSSSGGETAGGKPSDGGGAGGKPAGGTGGQASDPLEPKPLAGCPGYVKVFVPHGTCVWFHGDAITVQTPSCSLTNPAEGKCGTASAVSSDIETIISDNAEITRFDFDATGCPKKCN